MKKNLNIEYRKEIDGLRALAVLAVIFFHSEIKIYDYKFLKGGFLGVDIFFVISGYLISSIIIKEYETLNSFSFLYFIERRIRRILPLLFTVILITLIVSYFYLLPLNIIDLSKSSLYSILFISNFYFYFNETQYGGISSAFIPLLHTWSLSVEEQFYIFFPLLFVYSIKIFRNRIRYLIICLILLNIVFIQFLGNLKFDYPFVEKELKFYAPTIFFDFYFISSRIWELLIGVYIAILENHNFKIKDFKKSNFLSILGLLLILFSIFFFEFNETLKFPSILNVIPTLGVALIILYCKDQASLIYKFLSSKLIVFIGLISFSLYLWHYPIFAILKFNDREFKISWLIIIFFISIGTYFLIEKKFRNKELKFKFVLLYLFLSGLLIIIISNIYIKNNGMPDRLPEILAKDHKFKSYRNIRQDGYGCHNRINNFCIFNKGKTKKIILLGDSQTDSLLNSFVNNEKYLDYEIIHMSYSGNIYLPNIKTLNKQKLDISYPYTLERKKILDKIENQIIIISAVWAQWFELSYYDKTNSVENFSYYFVDEKEEQKDVAKIINNIIYDLAKKNYIVLVYPVPEPGVDVPRKLFNGIPRPFNPIITKNYLKTNIINIDYNTFQNRNKNVFNTFNQLQHNRILKVFPHDLFCNLNKNNKCIFHNDNDIFLADQIHLSAKGSQMVNELIYKEIKKIEKKKKLQKDTNSDIQ